MAAWLALGADAVISHETALEILGLSDVSGGTIHITLPRQQRGRRAPPGLTIHRPRSAELRSEDVLTREGMRITSPARSIVDAAAAGTDPEQVELAIHQAVKRGLVTPDQLLELASSRGRRVLEQVRQALEG
jgi:predicted transcriptional regulator of viral defense system